MSKNTKKKVESTPADKEGESGDALPKDDSATKYLVVYCKSDESFSLIDHTEAVFDAEEINIDEEANFFYNGEEYTGVVKAKGGK